MEKKENETKRRFKKRILRRKNPESLKERREHVAQRHFRVVIAVIPLH